MAKKRSRNRFKKNKRSPLKKTASPLKNIIYLDRTYQDNLLALKDLRPTLYQKMLDRDDAQNFRIMKTDKGLPNLQDKRTSLFLHSQTDPLQEAKIEIDKVNLNNTNCIVLLGLGLGYYAFELLKRIPSHCYLLIFELDKDIFRAAMNALDLRPLLERSNIDLLVGDHVSEIIPRLVNRLTEIKTTNVQVIAHSQSIQLHPEYKDIVQGIVKSVKIIRSNTETRFKYGLKWYENSLINILRSDRLLGVKDLFNKFRNVPAIIVSSGPSLDKNIKYLKRVKRGSAVLIAVDTALKCLISNSIKPDFVTSIDCQSITKSFFTDLDLEDIHLISPFRIPPAVIEMFEGRTVFCDDKELNLFEEFRKYTEGLGDINIGGTVAIFSFDLTRKLGCNPIIFLGQDLSFPQERFYAKDSYKEDIWFDEVSHISTLRSRHKELVNGMNPTRINNIFNSPVKTTNTMLEWLTWFDVEIRKTGAQCINATEEGIFQRDMTILPLKEAVSRYITGGNNKNRPCTEAIANNSSANSKGLIKDLIPVQQKLEITEQICREIVDTCHLLVEALSFQRNSELNLIHDKLKGLCNRLKKEDEFFKKFRVIYLIFKRKISREYQDIKNKDPRLQYILSIEMEAKSISEACRFIMSAIAKGMEHRQIECLENVS